VIGIMGVVMYELLLWWERRMTLGLPEAREAGVLGSCQQP